ncbi:uncharacterized protein At1g10890-like [Cucurbita pepo subsp. pepo]|uniref:uncharacterized protein At1g10890-like n=1 Tax=Cucurbita pepo subsp. pepo TaxID=3664 RepID=UPI000C9D8625|nr:uncharacterized protein At1g10890-like [Cucurbita pepo subsp. pepo]
MEEFIQKNVEEGLNSKETKLEIQRRIEEGRKKLFDDVDVQLEKEKKVALTATRQKEKQAWKEREELDKMLEENRRKVEKVKRRLALELQQKEEEQYRELKLIQRQKEEATRRTKLDDESLSYVLLGVSEESKSYRLYDIEATDKNIVEENISPGSLAEASSPSSNKARNKRPPVWMRDYAIGEDFCEEYDEAVWMRNYAIREVFYKEDDEAHSAMFTTTEPINFEDTLI